MRGGAGPFAARCAVNTDVTVPAVQEIIVELEAMRTAPPTRDELHAARDYLVGVFPLRFETPPAVVGALAGLIIQGLPMNNLDRYEAGPTRTKIKATVEREELPGQAA
jgi:predicted Zn-dependent peptidase